MGLVCDDNGDGKWIRERGRGRYDTAAAAKEKKHIQFGKTKLETDRREMEIGRRGGLKEAGMGDGERKEV